MAADNGILNGAIQQSSILSQGKNPVSLAGSSARDQILREQVRSDQAAAAE